MLIIFLMATVKIFLILIKFVLIYLPKFIILLPSHISFWYIEQPSFYDILLNQLLRARGRVGRPRRGHVAEYGTGVRAQGLERGGSRARERAAGRRGGGPKKKKKLISKIKLVFFFFLPHPPSPAPPLSLPAPSLYARLPQYLEYSKEYILLIIFLIVNANTESNLVCCTGQLVTTYIFAINRTSTKHLSNIYFFICSVVIFDSRWKIYICSMRWLVHCKQKRRPVFWRVL